LNSGQAQKQLEQTILEIIRNQKPETVQELLKLAKVNSTVPQTTIIGTIRKLQSEGKIKLAEPSSPQAQTQLRDYLKTKKAYWYWLTVASAIVTVTLVFTVSESLYPWVYARYIFGATFVLWLPGYALIKLLFPETSPSQTSKKDPDLIERTAFSIGMSLALVPIVGLLLNYTPWGIRPTPVTLSLLALTATSATIALARSYQATEKQAGTNE
jgi:hypothetical protein